LKRLAKAKQPWFEPVVEVKGQQHAQVTRHLIDINQLTLQNGRIHRPDRHPIEISNNGFTATIISPKTRALIRYSHHNFNKRILIDGFF